jgi:hypothetical protein
MSFVKYDKSRIGISDGCATAASGPAMSHGRATAPIEVPARMMLATAAPQRSTSGDLMTANTSCLHQKDPSTGASERKDVNMPALSIDYQSGSAFGERILNPHTAQQKYPAVNEPIRGFGYKSPLVHHSVRTVSLGDVESSAATESSADVRHVGITPSPPSRTIATVQPPLRSVSTQPAHSAVSFSTASWNAANKEIHCYTVLTLERSSLAAAWGLSISFHRDRVMIGYVNDSSSMPTTRQPAVVRGYWTTTSLVPPTSFIQSTDAQLSQFIRHLLTQPTPLASATAVSPAPLRHVVAAGDCLVGVAGVSVASLASLTAVTDLLRNYASTCLQIVLYQNQAARRAAASAFHMATANQNYSSMDPTYAAAHAAWQAMCHELDVPSPSVSNTVHRSLFTTPVLAHRNSGGASATGSVVSQHQKHVGQHVIPRYAPHPVHVPVSKNLLFVDHYTGRKGIPFADELYEFDPDEDNLAALFLVPNESTPVWLRKRKTQWRKCYSVFPILQDRIQEEAAARHNCKMQTAFWTSSSPSYHFMDDRLDCNVPVDFWTCQGFATHALWLAARTKQWQSKYSWNVRKRKALENDCVEVVHLPGTVASDVGMNDKTKFLLWLRVRKNQWQVQRRKRQRKDAAARIDSRDVTTCPIRCAGGIAPSSATLVTDLIDSLLEEQERQREARTARPPLDISFLFNSELGIPDDVVANVLGYLHSSEHGKLLCINQTARRQLMGREQLWRQLCPSHWKLPRRPRKPWHELYLSNLRIETERSRKLWDDVLVQASNMLQGRGQFHQIKHIVEEAERTCQFDVNYSSGVVCERNSLLNLAVLNRKFSTFGREQAFSLFYADLTVRFV